MEIRNKNILVIGMGKSGIAAAQKATKLGAFVTVFDENKKIQQEVAHTIFEKEEQITIKIGELEDAILSKIDLVIVSPGVPLDSVFMKRVQAANIPVIGELEFAYQNAEGMLIAITGTNGKTTTTTLVNELLKQGKQEVFAAGNIGLPYITITDQLTKDAISVVEVSSFQLETIHRFHPNIAAILNITPDHLNRHHTMEKYIAAKWRIVENQTPEDVCVLNYEDPVLLEKAGQMRAKAVYFSSKRELKEGIFLRSNEICHAKNGMVTPICDVRKCNLLGLHNYENMMAAIAIALQCNITFEQIREVLYRFQAVAHRIEYVTEKKGVRYYNDSKGTNPDAAIKAVQAMDRPTILIAGGYDKDANYTEWIRQFSGKVKRLILFGATKEKIAEEAKRQQFFDYEIVNTLQEAVRKSADYAKQGENVLLSPACASWDMFESYEQRGDLFKELVWQLGES